jgi:hypothetical protein
MYARVSGSSLVRANVAGAPSSANPTTAMKLGANYTGSANFFKGLLAQEIYYDHIPTAGETTQLANWAASIYSVAA